MNAAMRRVFVDPGAPQRDAIQEAAMWIGRGGLIALPTDTLYGLAVDPFRADAVGRVFAAKGRDADRALPLIAAGTDQVVASLGPLSPLAAVLAARFWPGPLTLLVAAPPRLAPDVTGTGTVGVRVPAFEVARAVCAACGHPVTATSANRSGEPATADPDVVERTLGDRLDFLLDAGPTPGGAPSTIVDVTAAEPRLVRAGAIAWDDVIACLNSARP
ncbi:MAG: threonylcarbamoyl-AMP synthase [Acidobacteria bacterium]|nr:threonylcarbamoyl-AMP synthase [Acidobacteriota bacterium]